MLKFIRDFKRNVMQVARDPGKQKPRARPAIPVALEPYMPNYTTKVACLTAMHDVALQRLREPALGMYLHGMSNRHARRALAAVTGGAHAKNAIKAVLLRELRAAGRI